MKFRGLGEYINILRANGELTEISTFCSPVLEITEITDRISKQKDGGKALLFSDNGTEFPVLINGYGSTSRMLKSLHLISYNEFGERVNELLKHLISPPSGLKSKLKIASELKKLSSYFPKQIKGKGECQYKVIMNPDLSILPVLKCWPHDADRFITLPIVHTKDPVTGNMNVGMYRMQIMGENKTGMHWHMHKTGARHYNEYKKLGKKIPVAVALGGDPVYAWCASAPLPDGINEYILAGFLRKEPVRMVKCITQDIEVPEDSDIVIEGYVDTQEPLTEEGPFGDHTGFYSLTDKYPVFHVTCITHRKNAVYPATIVGIPPQEDYYMIEATEKLFLPLIKLTQLPEICDMHMPACGVAHNLVIVSVKNTFPGNVNKIIHSLWGAGQMMFNKLLVVVDENTDIRNYNSLLKIIFKNTRLDKDIFFSSGASDVLDHAADYFAFTGKIGIDATDKNNIETVLPDISLKSLSNDILTDKRYIEKGIPVLLICIKHSSDINDITQIIKGILQKGNLIVINCDKEILSFTGEYVLWHVLANTDPSRDIIRISENEKNLWLVNAVSEKIKKDRSMWPSATIMDKNTINRVSQKWPQFKTGDLIDSPSAKFGQLWEDNAVKHNQQ